VRRIILSEVWRCALHTKTWITVGPNGTDISTDDGRNWRPLTPTPQDAPDTDKNWNALSLPFVVGPKGRIGKLRVTAISRNALAPSQASPSNAQRSHDEATKSRPRRGSRPA
jgi:hypothetical protein